MAEALKINNTLTDLILYHNEIGVEGAMAFAEVEGNDTLTSLDFNNNLGTEGGMALAEALKVNDTLTYLILFY